MRAEMHTVHLLSACSCDSEYAECRFSLPLINSIALNYDANTVQVSFVINQRLFVLARELQTNYSVAETVLTWVSGRMPDLRYCTVTLMPTVCSCFTGTCMQGERKGESLMTHISFKGLRWCPNYLNESIWYSSNQPMKITLIAGVVLLLRHVYCACRRSRTPPAMTTRQRHRLLQTLLLNAPLQPLADTFQVWTCFVTT